MLGLISPLSGCNAAMTTRGAACERESLACTTSDGRPSFGVTNRTMSRSSQACP